MNGRPGGSPPTTAGPVPVAVPAGAAAGAGATLAARGGERRIMQGGRAKAYRPLPLERRRAAFGEGMAAFGRGDFFEAHELLEPAWMGSDDLVERDLDQGLIKLAAAYVHAVRGNARGVATNLAGARIRLRRAAEAAGLPDVLDRLAAGGLDVGGLVREVDARLERLQRLAPAPVPGMPSGAAVPERRAEAARLLEAVPPPALGGRA